MTKDFEQLIRASGAPDEMMDQLWFIIFCHKFADNLLTLAEQELEDE